MKNTKKLPTKQLEKFSNIFTELGLVLVLFIVYITLEHQTEQKTIPVSVSYESQKVYLEPDKDIFFVKEKKLKPKAKVIKHQPFILEEVVKAKNDFIEIMIDTPIDDPQIINIEDLIEIKEPPVIIEDIDFVNIQNAPVFKGCEGLSKKENKRCFDKKMKQFVQRNFDLELANELGLHSGKHKIQTQFIINQEGNIIDLKIRAPHKRLEKETQRIIKKLPQFKPGKQNNKAVKVRYILPIAFSVQ